MTKAMKAFLSLLRPINCAMAAFAVFIGYAVSIKAIAFNAQLALAMLSAFLICGAGQAINDYFDRAIDKKKNPKKPIPSGTVSEKSALYYSFSLFAIGNILAVFVNQTAFAIALAFTLLLVFYSGFLGKQKPLGNWIVAAGTAFTLIFGSTIAGNYSTIFFFAASALLSNVVREIIKDTEDLQADYGYKQSLPMILKQSQLLGIILLLSILALALSLLPLLLGLFGNAKFLILLLLANVFFFYSVYCFAKNDFVLAQRLSKAGMLFALLGFLAGVL